ncbi:MAG: cytochrome P450 [Bacteroidota bacterium]|jgi:cytochrome P450
MITDILDITSSEYTHNPYIWYEKLRQKGNVHYLSKNQSWIVIGFAECIEILSNPQVFSSVGKYQFDPILLNCDPPTHTYHKRILSGENTPFSNSRIELLAVKNLKICENQLNLLKGKTAFDFLHEFALPYSSLVILALLGIEIDNNVDLLKWSNEAVSAQSISDRDYAQSNWMTLLPIVTKWVEEAYNKPYGKGLSEIIFHPNAQNYFSKEQLVSLVKILILGGNETTPTLVSSALYHLICKPSLMAEIRLNNHLLDPFINEVLRFYSPTQIIARTTKTDVIIGDVTIPSNSLVNVCIGAANRDPQVFENPNEFVVNRPKGRILSFGHGAHHCIGASLAKQETKIIFEALFSRYKTISTASSFIPEYRKSTHVRGLEKLPLIVE